MAALDFHEIGDFYYFLIREEILSILIILIAMQAVLFLLNKILSLKGNYLQLSEQRNCNVIKPFPSFPDVQLWLLLKEQAHRLFL